MILKKGNHLRLHYAKKEALIIASLSFECMIYGVHSLKEENVAIYNVCVTRVKTAPIM